MANALRAKSVWKSYVAGVQGCSARVWVLRGCSLEVHLGERVGIIGRRGAGKTTLLRCLAGQQRIDAGHIESPLLDRRYIVTPVDWYRLPCVPPGLLLFLDCSEAARDWAPQRSVLATARALGPSAAALVLTGLDAASVAPLVDRVLLLRDGRLNELTRVPAKRVAERPPPLPTAAFAVGDYTLGPALPSVSPLTVPAQGL